MRTRESNIEYYGKAIIEKNRVTYMSIRLPKWYSYFRKASLILGFFNYILATNLIVNTVRNYQTILSLVSILFGIELYALSIIIVFITNLDLIPLVEDYLYKIIVTMIGGIAIGVISSSYINVHPLHLIIVSTGINIVFIGVAFKISRKLDLEVESLGDTLRESSNEKSSSESDYHLRI